VGERTRAVLSEVLGYSAQRIEALRDAGVIAVVD
jgi:crotonobetainyl-CoA:carnitine CoA-transferase CaiB-like acyl-CoA transferase